MPYLTTSFWLLWLHTTSEMRQTDWQSKIKRIESLKVELILPKQPKNSDNKIYLIRKTLGLTQGKFASELGLSKSCISLFELEQRRLAKPYENLICLTFRINKEWLQKGEGDMFDQVQRIE